MSDFMQVVLITLFLTVPCISWYWIGYREGEEKVYKKWWDADKETESENADD